jgi:hypothetical protein
MEIVEMIDWYDGVVLAVVTMNWMKGTYLCSLLAFDVQLKKRVFALLPLDEDQLLGIREHLGGEWNALLLYLNQLWHNASNNVTLLYYRDTDEQVIAEISVEASKIKNKAISDVEEAVSDSRMSWFSAF